MRWLREGGLRTQSSRPPLPSALRLRKCKMTAKIAGNNSIEMQSQCSLHWLNMSERSLFAIKIHKAITSRLLCLATDFSIRDDEWSWILPLLRAVGPDLACSDEQLEQSQTWEAEWSQIKRPQFASQLCSSAENEWRKTLDYSRKLQEKSCVGKEHHFSLWGNHLVAAEVSDPRRWNDGGNISSSVAQPSYILPTVAVWKLPQCHLLYLRCEGDIWFAFEGNSTIKGSWI